MPKIHCEPVLVLRHLISDQTKRGYHGSRTPNWSRQDVYCRIASQILLSERKMSGYSHLHAIPCRTNE